MPLAPLLQNSLSRDDFQHVLEALSLASWTVFGIFFCLSREIIGALFSLKSMSHLEDEFALIFHSLGTSKSDLSPAWASIFQVFDNLILGRLLDAILDTKRRPKSNPRVSKIHSEMNLKF